jgi:hypothetical protein
LLAFPVLAREFNGQFAVEFLEGNEPIDHQIAEVWRAATAGREAPSSGALLEALAESEYAAVFVAMAAQNLMLDDDLEAGRADLIGAFAKLELERTQAELAALASQTPTGEVLDRMRELAERQSRLKEGAVAPDSL